MIQKFNKQPIEPDQPDLPNLPNLPNLHDQPDQRHQNELHLIGFGSQGRSWAQNLRDSGWSVRIYLSATSIQAASPSWVDAQNLGFEVRSTHELALLSSRSESHLIAFACPDHHIAGIYQDQLSQLNIPLSLILLHGFAVYSGELKLTIKCSKLTIETWWTRSFLTTIAAYKEGFLCHVSCVLYP